MFTSQIVPQSSTTTPHHVFGIESNERAVVWSLEGAVPGAKCSPWNMRLLKNDISCSAESLSSDRDPDRTFWQRAAGRNNTNVTFHLLLTLHLIKGQGEAPAPREDCPCPSLFVLIFFSWTFKFSTFSYHSLNYNSDYNNMNIYNCFTHAQTSIHVSTQCYNSISLYCL